MKVAPDIPQVHYIYKTDYHGNIVAKIPIYSELYMIVKGIPFVRNWREAYRNGTLRPDDYVMCDDGYIVKVIGMKDNIIRLQTATHKVFHNPDYYIMTSDAATYNTRRKFAQGNLDYARMRLTVREYLANGFDLKVAFEKVFKKKVAPITFIKSYRTPYSGRPFCLSS